MRTLLFPLLCFALSHSSTVAANSLSVDRLAFQSVNNILNQPDAVYIRSVQDHDGMIWFLTYDALVRFNGYEMTTFLSEYKGQVGGVDRYQQDLFVDRYNRVWVSKGCAAGYFDSGSENIHYYGLSERGEFSGVAGFADTPSGELYLLSTSGILFRFEADEDRFVRVVEPSSYVACYSFEIDSNGRFWAGGDGHLYEIKPDSGRFVSVLTREHPRNKESNRFYALEKYREHELLMSSEGFDFIRYNTETGESKIFNTGALDYRITQDSVGNIYVGCTEGLIVFRADSEDIFYYKHDPANFYSIPPGTVWSILVDRENNLWIGTSRSGLLVCYPDSGFENLHYQAPWNPLVPAKSNVSTILEDSKGRLWVGYHDDGLEMLDYQTGEQWYVDQNSEGNQKLAKGSVQSLYELPDGTIAAGISNISYSILNPELKTVINLEPTDTTNGPAMSDVRDFAQASDGKLWIMYHRNGVDCYDPSTGVYEHIVSSEKPIRPNLDLWLFDLLSDDQNRLWICSSWGIWVYRDGILDTEFTELIQKHVFLKENTITYMWQESHDVFWIGSNNGIARLNLGNSTLDQWQIKNGLPSNEVRSVLGTHNDQIWFGTDRGLVCLQTNSGEISFYDKGDGLPTADFYHGAAMESKSGWYYFAGKHGVLRFKPENVRPFDRIPNLLITGFNLYGQPVKVGATDDPNAVLKQPIQVTDTITLPFEPYTLSFEFVALSYRNSRDNRYSYKLEGFDENWSRPSDHRLCTYTNLNPGSYTFRVKASNSEGYWNENGASIELIILPPFWQRLWFRLFVLLLLIAALGGVYYLRIRSIYQQRKKLSLMVDRQTQQIKSAMLELESQKSQIMEQNKLLVEYQQNLETKIHERTKELELAKFRAEESDHIKSAFLANMSHEFRTPLNVILGSVSILCSDDLEDNERVFYSNALRRSSDTLIRLLDSILDLSKMEAGQLPINIVPVEVNEFLRRTFQKFRLVLDIIDMKSINFVLHGCEESAPDVIVQFDPIRMEQLLMQLLDNAYKFTNRGNVWVGFREQVDAAGERCIEFYVKDTGIGIPEKQLEAIFEKFAKFYNDNTMLHPGAGVGLTIVKKLTESMNGTIRVVSKVGVGTEMIVTFPVSGFLSEI